MFGEGVHPKFPELLERELGPFLSQGALNFWWVMACEQSGCAWVPKGLFFTHMERGSRKDGSCHWQGCSLSQDGLHVPRRSYCSWSCSSLG